MPHQGRAPVPELSQGRAPVPELSQGRAPVPELSPGRAPVPELSPGRAPVPELSPGRAPVPEFSPGKAPVPEFRPERPEAHKCLPSHPLLPPPPLSFGSPSARPQPTINAVRAPRGYLPILWRRGEVENRAQGFSCLFPNCIHHEGDVKNTERQQWPGYLPNTGLKTEVSQKLAQGQKGLKKLNILKRFSWENI